MTNYTMGFEYEADIDSYDFEEWFEGSHDYYDIHDDGDGREFATGVFNNYQDCIEYARDFVANIRPYLRKPYGINSGIHVHISERAFNLDQIASLVLWMNGPANTMFTRLSGRLPTWGWWNNAMPRVEHILCARAHLMGYRGYTAVPGSGHRVSTRAYGGRLAVHRDGMLCCSDHPTYEQRMYWSSPDLLIPAIQQLHLFSRMAEGGHLDKYIQSNIFEVWARLVQEYPELYSHYRGELDYGKDKAARSRY